MKRRHKIVSCFICLALLLGAFGVWRFERRERPLLEIATVVDIPTTVTVPFPEILKDTHSGAVLSPDGKWVMWHDDEGVHTGEIATRRRMDWKSAGDTMHLQNYWLSDSHHWLQFTTAPDYVTLHCVDSSEQSVRMTFPKSGSNDTLFNYSDACVTSASHIIVTLGHSDVIGMRPGVTITEYVMQPQLPVHGSRIHSFRKLTLSETYRGRLMNTTLVLVAWRNSGKSWNPNVPCERHTIQKSGMTQNHDQCFADFACCIFHTHAMVSSIDFILSVR